MIDYNTETIKILRPFHMKTIVLYSLFVIAPLNILSQDLIKNTKITDSITHTIMTKKWDTLNFNAYKNQSKTLPFKVTFTDSMYSSPIKRKKVITSRYGWRKGKPHRGIDIDLVTGDDVMAMFDGIVRFVRYSSGHGRTIVIRHYNGLETAYAHLSKYLVKVNDTIKKGQVIGKGGTTGNARGSHLHLVVSYEGNFINPEYLFDFNENNKIRHKNIWVTKKWVKAQFHSSKRQSKLDFVNTYEEALISQKKQSRSKIYFVKSGDTLSEISNKYNISLSRLCKINALSKTRVLKIGQKIIINY